MFREQHQLLTRLCIGHAHDCVPHPRPGPKDEFLYRRERHHFSTDLGKPLGAAEDPHEAVLINSHEVPGVIPARAACGRWWRELTSRPRTQIPEHHVRATHAQPATVRQPRDWIQVPCDARQETPDTARAVL